MISTRHLVYAKVRIYASDYGVVLYGAGRGQLAKAAEKLRSAQLLLLKADLCRGRATRLRNFRVTELSRAAQESIANIEEQARKWEPRALDEILRDAVL